MTNYKCGCKTDGVIILNDNILSMTAYLQWADSVGVNGSKEQCWECWNKEMDASSEESASMKVN